MSKVLATNIHILFSLGVKTDTASKNEVDLINEYARPENTSALVRILKSLGFQVSVNDTSLANYREVLQSFNPHDSIVFNLCDGAELDGFPGVSIINEMDRLQLKYTGCNSQFYKITRSKPPMKTQLIKSGVPTMPFIEINEDTQPEDIDTHLKSYPVIVKPSVSYGSLDLTHKSVCFNAQETIAQAKLVRARALNGVFAEGFLAGREFTVLLTGDSILGINVFPAVERVFNKELSTYERFLDFDQYWAGYIDTENNDKKKDAAYQLYQYQLVSNDENQILAKLARDAYEALGGNGYAR
jgi:D-alanine-D-alanine ligase-like ATP-grasp enzyme